jgi:prepilin-type N-terminal cleavage/methylation domain-containing protein
MRARRGESGFTLLEVLIASLVMAIAVAGLLANLTTSLRNGARVTDSDRAASIARGKIDELLLDAKLPHNAELGGLFDPRLTGWPNAGWRAVVEPYEIAPGTPVNGHILERIRLEVWWNDNGRRRSFPLEAYRAGRRLESDPPRIEQP